MCKIKSDIWLNPVSVHIDFLSACHSGLDPINLPMSTHCRGDSTNVQFVSCLDSEGSVHKNNSTLGKTKYTYLCREHHS